MILTNNNYTEFCEAFNELVDLAKNDDAVRNYVYDLHNKITDGATKRIFKDKNLPLTFLTISQMNFERYINQNNCKMDLYSALSVA